MTRTYVRPGLGTYEGGECTSHPQCSKCRDEKRWGSIGIEHADWITWCLGALQGHQGAWKEVEGWPPFLDQHTTP